MTTDSSALLTLVLAGVQGEQAEALAAGFGSLHATAQSGTDRLHAAGLDTRVVSRIVEPEREALERCERWLGERRHALIGWEDTRYPSLLRTIQDPPLALFVAGDPDCLALPQLAIVGSRSATRGGRENARQFAAFLARHGFCITSGLAIGIDAAAHEGALAVDGKTIAVCAHGLDRIYPDENTRLASSIEASGCVVSEWPPGIPPLRHHFPQHNRLISGLSAGTLVVEAGQRSGALITARLAGEQGREVFAIPGSIHNPLSKGCHQLIRNGAKLVETARDIVVELSPMLSSVMSLVEQNTTLRKNENDCELDREYQELLDVMGFDPVSVDTLVKRAGLTPEVVSSMLLILELRGFVAPEPGGRYQRREEGQREERRL